MPQQTQHERALVLQGASVPPSTSTKTKPMTRRVSWDPTVTVFADSRACQTSRRSCITAVSRQENCESRRSDLLHPLLAPESNPNFDARLAPATVFPGKQVAEPATASGARHLRIISPDFPWTFEVSSRHQHAVTCLDVLSAIYAGLSIPLTSSEWTLADDAKKDSMMRANKNRRGGSVRRLRRIDWLGSRVYFKGLTRDDELGRARLLPQDDLWPDTWVVKFGSR